jgi:hypothetical protein
MVTTAANQHTSAKRAGNLPKTLAAPDVEGAARPGCSLSFFNLDVCRRKDLGNGMQKKAPDTGAFFAGCCGY